MKKIFAAIVLLSSFVVAPLVTHAQSFEALTRAAFPAVLGDFRLVNVTMDTAGGTDEAECFSLEDHDENDVARLQGEVCVKIARGEYRSSDGTKLVAINLADFTKNFDLMKAFIEKVTSHPVIGGTRFFQFDKYELGWFPTSGFEAIIAQEAAIGLDNSFDHEKNATGDNAVTNYFLTRYSPTGARPLVCGALGDVNADGKITAVDANLLENIIEGTFAIESQRAASDINKDGVLNTSDLAAIRQYIASGATSSFTCSSARATITVTSPMGGETYTLGTPIIISWKSSSSNPGDSTRIELYKRGIYVEQLVSNQPVNGSYSWTASADKIQPGSDYTIRVVKSYDATNSVFGESASYFRINAPTVVTKSLVCGALGDVNGDGKITQIDVNLLTNLADGVWASAAQKAASDVNKDNALDSRDVTALQQYFSGSSRTLPGCTVEAAQDRQTAVRPVTIALTANGSENLEINSGYNIKIVWSASSNATSCTNTWGDSRAISGVASVSANPSTPRYSITCTDAAGVSATKTVYVRVGTPSTTTSNSSATETSLPQANQVVPPPPKVETIQTVPDRTAQVTAAYWEILKRAPDAGGLDYFVKSNMTLDQIKSIMRNSEEYRAQQTAPTQGVQGSPTSKVRMSGDLLGAVLSGFSSVLDYFIK